MFTKNSALVAVWVRLVTGGEYTRDQVPKLFNLQEVVWGLLDEQASGDKK